MAVISSRLHGLGPRRAQPKRPLSIRIGKRLRRSVDALIERSSRVSNAPMLDPYDFAWTRMLRNDWAAIRREALAVVAHLDEVPLLDKVSPDHKRIAPPANGAASSCAVMAATSQRIWDVARAPPR